MVSYPRVKRFEVAIRLLKKFLCGTQLESIIDFFDSTLYRWIDWFCSNSMYSLIINNDSDWPKLIWGSDHEEERKLYVVWKVLAFSVRWVFYFFFFCLWTGRLFTSRHSISKTLPKTAEKCRRVIVALKVINPSLIAGT